MYAIRSRARELGIVSRRHVWTNRETARLRLLRSCGTKGPALAAAFPGLTKGRIIGKARHIGLGRVRRTPRMLDIPPLDTIRQQAAMLDLTLCELDRLAGTKRFFQKTTRRVDWHHLSRAVEALGGTIEITWRP